MSVGNGGHAQLCHASAHVVATWRGSAVDSALRIRRVSWLANQADAPWTAGPTAAATVAVLAVVVQAVAGAKASVGLLTEEAVADIR